MPVLKFLTLQITRNEHLVKKRIDRLFTGLCNDWSAHLSYYL